MRVTAGHRRREVAKARVSALAKEVGKTSKELIEWLNNNGEYVKTPSSTVEAPVVAKVYAAFPKVAAAGSDGAEAAAPAKKPPAKTPPRPPGAPPVVVPAEPVVLPAEPAAVTPPAPIEVEQPA